jgi:hypothetical protein
MVARAFGCSATWRPCHCQEAERLKKSPGRATPNLRLQHSPRREVRRRQPVEFDGGPSGERQQHIAVGRRALREDLPLQVEAVTLAEYEAVDLVVAGADQET